MARTVLPNGTILPAEYSDDWYEDMTSNLTKLDDVIGSDSEKLNSNDVSFLRMSSAALTDNGTGNFSDLNSSNKLKTGDYVLDFNRKLFVIVSVDSANETFTVGNSLFKVTAESDLAAVAESGDYDDLDNKPALKPVATSGDYDDLTDLPTYGITRFCSSAITDNSSVAFSSISSTNKIKIGDFLLDTAGKLYQISAVDTANETVSVTTPLTRLAVDSDVVHKSGNESIAGEKTFSNMSSFQGSYLGNEASTNARTDLVLESNRDTHGQSGIYIKKFRQDKPQGGLTGNDVVYMTLDVLENSVRTNNALRFNFKDFVNDVPTSIAFYPTGINNSLGGSTSASNKWTKINGLNPGSLSFPDLNNGIDISGYITPGNSNNTYTPLVDGYVSVNIGIASGGCAVFLSQGDLYNACYSATGAPDVTGVSAWCMLPVKGGVQMNIGLKGGNNYINSAKFYPCLGNV